MSPKTYYLKNIYNYMTVYSILEGILFDTVTYPLRGSTAAAPPGFRPYVGELVVTSW
jgi:hypothetical protein